MNTTMLAVVMRILLAVVGAYFLTQGLSALLTAGLANVVGRPEAYNLSTMLGLLIFIALILWAFTERRLLRVALVIPGGTAASFGLAYWLAS